MVHLLPGKETGGKQMKEKIGMRVFSVLLAMMLVSMVIVPAVSARATHVMPEPVGIDVSDDELREMITKLTQDLKSSDLDPQVKEQFIESLQKIIRGQRKIDREELEKTLIEIGTVYLGEGQGGIRWAGFIHNDMAKIAGEKMGLSYYEYNTTLGTYADDPDSWGYSWNHYKMTGAPGEAEYYANLAKTYYQEGDTTNGATNLAYSMHFMTDMSMPFHYMYYALPLHTEYESYVSGQWESDHDFRDVVEDNYYYYYITDVSDSADNLAAVSNQYLNYIETTMNQDPNWQDDPTLIQYTENCILHGARYNMGLVDYVKR